MSLYAQIKRENFVDVCLVMSQCLRVVTCATRLLDCRYKSACANNCLLRAYTGSNIRVTSGLVYNRAAFVTMKASTATIRCPLCVWSVPSQRSSAFCSGYALSPVKPLDQTRSGGGHTVRADKTMTSGVVATSSTLAHGLWILLGAAPVLASATEYLVYMIAHQ